jgi:hypothetical protein
VSSSVGVVSGAGEIHDPVGLPGVAGVGGKRLFPWADRAPMPDQTYRTRTGWSDLLHGAI